MKVISTLELTYESIREETRKDPILAKLLRKLMQDQSIDSYPPFLATSYSEDLVL